MPPAKTALRYVRNPAPGTPRRVRQTSAPPAAAPGRDFPTWAELAADNVASVGSREETGRLARVPTFRMALIIAVLGTLFTLYVGHVHATQQLVDRLQVLDRENLALHLTYNQVKGRFDQATAPTVIHARARALGLSEARANGFPIVSGDRRP